MFLRLSWATMLCMLLTGSALAQVDIQQQIERARPGQTVSIPAGTFAVDNLVLKDGVSLKGAGYQRTILDASGSENGLIIHSTTASAVRDLAIVNAVQSGIVVHRAEKLTLERLLVRKCGGSLVLANANNSTVQNLVLADNKSGVSLSACTGSAFMNVTIANIDGAGLRVNGSSNLAIFNNVIFNVPYGISLGAGNNALTIDHNIYVANYVGEQQGDPMRKKVEAWYALTGHDRHSQTIGVSFADAAQGDYRPISPLSWAPVRATTSDWGRAELAGFKAPSTDIDGKKRAAGVDLGAYEVSFPAPRPADGRFTITSGDGVASAGIFTKEGMLVRYLFQNTPLAKGTHQYWLPSRDWQGRLIAAGDYQFKLTESNMRLAYIAAAGNGDLAMSTKEFGGTAKRASLDPHAVAFAADGRLLLAQSGFESGEFIRSYDADMTKFLWSFPGGGHTVGFTIDAKGHALILRNDRVLMRLDGTTGKGAPFGNGLLSKGLAEQLTGANGMTTDGERVYIADTAANKIVHLSGADLEVAGTWDVAAPSQPAYDDGSKLLWVISEQKALLALNAEGQVQATVTPLEAPALLAARNGRLAVYDRQTKKITVFDSSAPAELKVLRIIGTGGEGYGPIRGDRFWDPSYLAMNSRGELAIVDRPRTILLAADGSMKRQHMGMWGQQMSYGQFAGDDRMHFFNIGANWSIVLDARKRAWEQGVRWNVPNSLGASLFFFNNSGQNFGLFYGGSADNLSFSLARMDLAQGQVRTAVRYGWDVDGLYLQRDIDGDGIIEPNDVKEPVLDKNGERFKDRFIDRGFNNLDFRPDGAIVHPARNGLRIIPLKGLDAQGIPLYDFANIRFLRYTSEGDAATYLSPYDFKTEETISVAEDTFLMPDGTFNAVVTTKSGPGPDMATEHANGTSMAGFDAQGRMRWLWPLNPFGLKMGFWGITTIGGITFAGRGAICEYETMDRDGLGTGVLGMPKEFGWGGMWLDNHRQTIGFTGNDGKPYLVTGDYAAQTYHWQELLGWDSIVRNTDTLVITQATADKLAALEAQPVPVWPVPAPPRVTIKKLVAPLPIDGNPAKWRTLGIQPLVTMSGNPASSSAVIRMAYEGDNLYLQLIKFDDVVTFHQSETGKHYLQDGIEFSLNSFMEGWKYNVTKMLDGQNIVLRDRWGGGALIDEQVAPRILQVYENAGDFEERALIEAATGLDMSKSKVVYIEFKLTKEALAGMPANRQVTFESGKTFIFGFMINDNDLPGADTLAPIVWPVTYGTFERDDRYATGVFE